MVLEDKEHYSVKEFAAAVGYSDWTVRDLIKDGHILAEKWQWRGPTPFRFMIPREEVVRWGLLDNNGLNGVST